jgi:predicted ATPase
MPRPLKIVLTGAPGSGKTVISAQIALSNPSRYALVREAATQVYTASHTRWDQVDVTRRRRLQREIYYLQREQEDRIARDNPGKILILDRGTLDGAAYWPDGPENYMQQLNTTQEQELARYHQILLLETAAKIGIYDGDASNAIRFEDAAGAIAAGEPLAHLWSPHPNIVRIPAQPDFREKLATVRKILDAIE